MKAADPFHRAREIKLKFLVVILRQLGVRFLHELANFDGVQNVVAAVLQRHLVVNCFIQGAFPDMQQESRVAEVNDLVADNHRSLDYHLKKKINIKSLSSFISSLQKKSSV